MIMSSDFFIQDNDGHVYNGVRIKDNNNVDFSLDTLFGNGSFATTDYHTVRTLSNGYTVKYYLTYHQELYGDNWWSITIKLPKKVERSLKKISDACCWNDLFTEESIKKVFKNYPHILNSAILRKGCGGIVRPIFCDGLTKFEQVNELTEHREITAVEELVNEALGILKELSYFRINTEELVKKPQVENQKIVLPDWLKTGINGVIRLGARALSSYIGANVDVNIGNFDIGNVDVGDVDFGDADFGDVDFGIDCLDSGDFDSNFGLDNGNNNISFGHATNDGTYTRTSQTVNIISEYGVDKGSYNVYYHHGDKYIDFHSQWIKIQGKQRFSFSGVGYVIK